MKKTDFSQSLRPRGSSVSRAASPVAAFDKILRAFDTGGFTYTDFLEQLNQLLDTGAPAAQLLDVLRRRELIEPLPRTAYSEVLGLLNEAMARQQAAAAAGMPIGGYEVAPDDVPEAAPVDASEVESVFEADYAPVEPDVESQFAHDASDDAPHIGPDGIPVLASPDDAGSAALAAELAAARAALESEQKSSRDRSEEAARKLHHYQEELSKLQDELAARDAALATAGTLLESERSKAQEASRALAESFASTDVAIARGEEALNELSHYQAELRTLRDARAAGDAALAEARRALGERDAELKASQSAAAALNAHRDRLQAQAAGSQAQIASLQGQAAGLQAQIVKLQSQVASLKGQVASAQTGLDPSASSEPAEPAPLPPPKSPGRPRAAEPKTFKMGRPLAVVAAILIFAGAAWFIAHREVAPPPEPPPAAAPAQAAGTVIHDCPACPAMTVLPAGRFQQGSDRADAPPFEKPLHEVSIDRPLAMSTTAVTVFEFQQFVAATSWDMQGCDTYDGQWKHTADNNWKSPGFTQTATHPVTCASWEDAQAYAEWLTTKTGHKYRLPSASEWEYAARAGSDAVQPWNSDASEACAYGNFADASAAKVYRGWTVFPCDDGYANTAPVGGFKANAFGLKDMLGNVLQWTEDCWHPDYNGAPVDGSARDDVGCSERELRGGSWFSTPAYVRADYRNHFASDYRTSSVGIRLVRDVEQ